MQKPSNMSEVLGQFIGGGFGLLGSYLNNKYQQENAERKNQWDRENAAEARKENYQYGEMAADNADARTRALYADLYSPSAMMQQYKDAGLNVGLLAGNGMGSSGTSGAQGNGASGTATPGAAMALTTDYIASMMQGANLAANIKKTDAEIDNIKADTEGKEIANANDPQLKDYIIEKQTAITNANEKEAELVNNAFNTFTSAMVNIGYFSENVSISRSHSEGESGSEGSGWTISVSDGHGDSKSFNVGGSVSAHVGVTNGGSVSGNYGESEAHNEQHAHGEGKNESHAWAKNVANAIADASGKSGNKTELVQLLNTFYDQCKTATSAAEKSRNEARDNYEFRVWKYEKNRSKHK